MERTTIMVLDDHPVVLHGVVQLLRSDQSLEVTGAYLRSTELLKAMALAPPALVVLDYLLNPGEADGLNLLRRIRKRFPDTQVIFLSGAERPANIQVLLSQGASAFVGKSRDPETLLTAVRTVLRRKTFVSPALPPTTEATAPDANLTVMQRQIMQCCMAGLRTSEIAAKLCLSKATISTHKRAAFDKLGIQSDPDLHRALAHHLLDHLL